MRLVFSAALDDWALEYRKKDVLGVFKKNHIIITLFGENNLTLASYNLAMVDMFSMNYEVDWKKTKKTKVLLI